uniref:Uncharacterized protein n=2 Tax=Caenorhabditis japonica TaxID=281687 RepID=A0A8R1ELE4_CAEJA
MLAFFVSIIVERWRTTFSNMGWIENVSPEDGVEIDSTYKPSAGTVGRTLNSIVDFFKEKFMRSSFSMPDKNRWKFDWEFAMIGRMFVPLSSMHFSASESISDRIRRFNSKDEADFRLGDRYELVLRNVDANNSGHYRCVNNHERHLISQMYFLEVSNSKNIVEPTVNVPLQKKEYLYLNLYDKVPCSSTLVPLHLRKKLKEMGNHKIYLESRPCYEECTSEEEIRKSVNSSQDLGDIRTLDYLPGGEFVFGNILPRLLPPVVRRLVLENDPQVLSCQKLIDINAGVHWYSLRNGPIQHSNIHTLYANRAYFDEDTNLVFREFTMADDDEYFLLLFQHILLNTFHMRVVENDQHHQIIEVVRIL